MAVAPDIAEQSEMSYVGLRLSADEFLEIQDDWRFYELIDGVVVVSPSPTPEHQSTSMEIARQLANYCEMNPVGRVFPEQDVHIGKGPTGGDLVYRPEVIFIRREKLKGARKKISGAPDIVVEVISGGSRRYDTKTKLKDYERFGVAEFWLFDPARKSQTFYRLEGGKFAEVSEVGDQYHSQVIPGFILDLKKVRATYEPW